MKTDIIAILQELKFTEYEAKAYLALLEKSPLSGYAISLNSGVPRSKIYEVLNGMVARGDILVSQENTPQYFPLSPKELIAQRKRDAEKTYQTAHKALKKFEVSSQNRGNIWNISGHEAILARVKEKIKDAKRRILLEIWQEDAQELGDVLEKASQRGVDIIIVSYGELKFDFATIYQHHLSEEITIESGGRWIVFSVDDEEIVAGIISLGDESRAAWTAHPGLIKPISEIIIHDIYIMEIMKIFRKELEEEFGPNLIKLRNKFALGPHGEKNISRIK